MIPTVSVGKNEAVSRRNFACFVFGFIFPLPRATTRVTLSSSSVLSSYLHFLNTLALWLTVPLRLPVSVLPVFVFPTHPPFYLIVGHRGTGAGIRTVSHPLNHTEPAFPRQSSITRYFLY